MANSVYEIQMSLEGNEQVRRELNETQSSLDSFGRQSERTGQRLTQLGQQVGLAGAALTAFTGKTAQMAAEYEKNLAALKSVSTEATGSTKEFDEALNSLSNEMDGAITKNEAAKASYDILSAGIKDQSAVLEVLEQSQKAAVGGFSELSTIANATTSIMNSYSSQLESVDSETEQVKFITDQLIQTQNLGNITGGEYAQQIGRISSIASTAGVSLKELNTVIATATANGQTAEGAFTGLRGAISNIIKPSGQATEMAEKLGIQFNAAALESKGLGQFLNDLNNKIDSFVQQSGGDRTEIMGQLFGDVEALNTALSVTGQNMDSFNEKLKGMQDATGEVNKAYNDLANTTFQEAQRAMNKLQNNLVDFGRGALVAFEPVIEAANKALDAFNSLDPEMKKLLGTFTAVTGGVMAATGAISTLVATYQTLSGAISALIPAVTGMTASLKSATLATTSLSTSARALAVTLGPIAAGVTAVGAAAVAGKKHLDNMNKELDNLETKGRQAELGPLINGTNKLIKKMEETGEAISEKKFEGWLKTLKNAKQEMGENTKEAQILQDTIDALKSKQEEHKNTQEKSNKATEESKNKLDQQSKSVEEAKKEFEKYKKSIDDTIKSLEKQSEIQTKKVDLSDKSESDKIQERLKIQKDTTKEQIKLLKDLANQSQASAKTRKEAEQKVQEKKIELQEKQQDAQKRLQELQFEKTKARQQQAVEAAKARWEAEGKSFTETYKQRKQLARETWQVEKNILQKQIQQATQGSTKRAKLQQELASKRRQHLQQVNRLEEKFQQEQLNRIREQAQIRNAQNKGQLAKLEAQWKKTGQTIIDTFQQRKNLIQQSTQSEIQAIQQKLQVVEEGSTREAELQQQLAEAKKNQIEEIEQLESNYYDAIAEKQQQAIEAEQRRLELSQEQSSIRQQELSNQNDLLESQEDIFGTIKGHLEDENASWERKRQLAGLVEELTGKTLRNSEGGLSVSKAQNAIQDKLAQIEQKKLNLKIQQLKNDRQQLKVATQIKQLDIKSEIADIESKIKQAENKEEKSRLRQRKSTLEQQKELEQRKQKVGTEGINQEIEMAKTRKELKDIISSTSSKERQKLDGMHKSLHSTAKNTQSSISETGRGTQQSVEKSSRGTQQQISSTGRNTQNSIRSGSQGTQQQISNTGRDTQNTINNVGQSAINKFEGTLTYFQQQQEKADRERRRQFEQFREESNLPNKELGDTSSTSFKSNTPEHVEFQEMFPDSNLSEKKGRFINTKTGLPYDPNDDDEDDDNDKSTATIGDSNSNDDDDDEREVDFSTSSSYLGGGTPNTTIESGPFNKRTPTNTSDSESESDTNTSTSGNLGATKSNTSTGATKSSTSTGATKSSTSTGATKSSSSQTNTPNFDSKSTNIGEPGQISKDGRGSGREGLKTKTTDTTNLNTSNLQEGVIYRPSKTNTSKESLPENDFSNVSDVKEKPSISKVKNEVSKSAKKTEGVKNSVQKVEESNNKVNSNLENVSGILSKINVGIGDLNSKVEKLEASVTESINNLPSAISESMPKPRANFRSKN